MKFNKNLYYSLSVFIGVPCFFLFIEIITSIASIWGDYPLAEALVYTNLSMLAMLLLYLVLRFKFIFQYVIIDERGISVCFFKKTLQRFRWSDIASIQKSSFASIRSYKIVLQNENFIYLERRKAIKKAIETYYSREVL